MAETYCTTKEAAAKLKIPETRLYDLLRRGKIGEPAWINGTRAWTKDNIELAAVVVKRNGKK